MSGNLQEVNLADILQIISLTPQYTSVILKKQDDTTAGTIFVQNSMFMEAEVDELSHGMHALMALLTKQHSFFEVFRIPPPDAVPSPLGSIESLLLEAAVQMDDMERDDYTSTTGEFDSALSAFLSEKPEFPEGEGNNSSSPDENDSGESLWAQADNPTPVPPTQPSGSGVNPMKEQKQALFGIQKYNSQQIRKINKQLKALTQYVRSMELRLRKVETDTAVDFLKEE